MQRFTTISQLCDVRYEGAFLGGLIHGKGVYQWANGSRYEGGFAAGKREGEGIMMYDNGDVFDGCWSAGMRNGEGTLSCNHGRVVHSGKWFEDKPVSLRHNRKRMCSEVARYKCCILHPARPAH